MNTAATARLGETDVLRIGLGTNRLTDTGEHAAFVRAAVDLGVNHLDTAHVYSGGESERAIGEALAPIPDDCVVATKGGAGKGNGRPDVLRSQVEQSLSRLRVDAIPLYYLHRVDPETPLEESLGVLAEYRERGAIRHVGISEVTVEQIERARRVVPIAAVQNHFNLSERKWDAVVDHCAEQGIAFVPYFPLGGRGGRALPEIAERHGATPSQITLAWLLRRSPAMLPIPGTLSLDHLRQNLGALDVELGDEELRALA